MGLIVFASLFQTKSSYIASENKEMCHYVTGQTDGTDLGGSFITIHMNTTPKDEVLRPVSLWAGLNAGTCILKRLFSRCLVGETGSMQTVRCRLRETSACVENGKSWRRLQLAIFVVAEKKKTSLLYVSRSFTEVALLLIIPLNNYS